MPGDCHYLDGNTNAKRRIGRVKELLTEIGLEPERVEMFNMSAAEANRFVEVANEMSERITELGPNPLRMSGNKLATENDT
jgi:F420-non-reducing hydrogenase iron-sulfur subunit